MISKVALMLGNVYILFYFHLHLHTDEVVYETGLCNKCICIVSHTIVNMSTNN